MNFRRRIANAASQLSLVRSHAGNGVNAARTVTTLLGATSVVLCSVVLCSVLLFSQSKPSSQPAQSSTASTSSSLNTLPDAQMSKMSSDELAHYVFEHHGCNNCHTLGANGKLGFTDRGKQVGKGFEGCISLLTSMNVIAQVKPGDRSTEEKQKAARFQEFGCTTCHQITPGKLGLTSYGTKLKSLHMACTDVEKLLAQQR
jgi:cytochrome c551/c552